MDRSIERRIVRIEEKAELLELQERPVMEIPEDDREFYEKAHASVVEAMRVSDETGQPFREHGKGPGGLTWGEYRRYFAILTWSLWPEHRKYPEPIPTSPTQED